MPAAGAAADSPDQKGDKGQVRSSTAGRLEGDTGATEKSPCTARQGAGCFTHGVKSVPLNHTHTRGLSVTRMQDFSDVF